jgi:hypothetical protein
MENYVANVIPHLQQWWQTIIVIIYVLGLITAFRALYVTADNKNRVSKRSTLLAITAAVLLLNMPSFMDSLSMTLFNQSSEQSLSYSPPSSPASVYIQFAVYAIMTIGLIGIARGICLLAEEQQSRSIARAITHIVGGIIAANIVTFLRGIGATVGGDVQSYIAKIIG